MAKMTCTESTIDPRLLDLSHDRVALYNEINYTYQVEGLFGINAPSVPVIGSLTAIHQLQHAIRVNGLSVLPYDAATPAGLLPVAFHHLEKEMQFPDSDVLRILRDLQHGQTIISLVRPDPVRTDCISAKSSPDFINLDADKVLAAFRIAAEIQGQVLELVLEKPVAPKKSCQLGIVTMITSRNEAAVFKAEVFGNDLLVTQSVNTIWLFRCCEMKEDGRVDEQWRAIGDGTFDHMKPQATQTRALEFATSTSQHGKVHKAEIPVFPPALSNSHDTMISGPATLLSRSTLTSSPPVNPNKRKRDSPVSDRADSSVNTPTPNDGPESNANRPRYRFLTHPPPFYLFDSDPEKIRGAAILSLAGVHSNQELFLMINDALRLKGKPVLKNENVVTRRITLACYSVAKKYGNAVTHQHVRSELDQQREANNIKERQLKRTKQTKAANRDARRRAMAAQGAHTNGYRSPDAAEAEAS